MVILFFSIHIPFDKGNRIGPVFSNTVFLFRMREVARSIGMRDNGNRHLPQGRALPCLKY